MDYLQQLYARLFGTNPEDVSPVVNNTNGVNNATATTTNSLPRKVVAFGNVLLDHTAHISNTELLDRYKLSLNTRGEMDVETITKVTSEAIVNKKANNKANKFVTVKTYVKFTKPLFCMRQNNNKSDHFNIRGILTDNSNVFIIVPNLSNTALANNIVQKWLTVISN